jgi:hypothetical protein
MTLRETLTHSPEHDIAEGIAHTFVLSGYYYKSILKPSFHRCSEENLQWHVPLTQYEFMGTTLPSIPVIKNPLETLASFYYLERFGEDLKDVRVGRRMTCPTTHPNVKSFEINGLVYVAKRVEPIHASFQRVQ